MQTSLTKTLDFREFKRRSGKQRPGLYITHPKTESLKRDGRKHTDKKTRKKSSGIGALPSKATLWSGSSVLVEATLEKPTWPFREKTVFVAPISPCILLKDFSTRKGVWGRGCDEADISEGKRHFTEWGQGTQWIKAFGKEVYRKGNSVKRFGPLSEPPDSEKWIFLRSSHSPILGSCLVVLFAW